MRKTISLLVLALTIFVALPALASTSDADGHVRDLEAMCEASSHARADRQADKSLFERLGKDAKIHVLTREIVRLHLANDAIKHLVDERYADHLAKRVAEFIISGTGGEPIYNGPSLSHSHEHLKLTNADFMAAGGDVIQAMKNLGYGQDEIDEVVCILVSLRDQVVLGG
jgi:truncated hemoglobin YjbI